MVNFFVISQSLSQNCHDDAANFVCIKSMLMAPNSLMRRGGKNDICFFCSLSSLVGLISLQLFKVSFVSLRQEVKGTY